MAKNTKIFVNLPVKDLDESIGFFTKLGFKFNPQFTDQNTTCMIINENSFVIMKRTAMIPDFLICLLLESDHETSCSHRKW